MVINSSFYSGNKEDHAKFSFKSEIYLYIIENRLLNFVITH